MPKKSKKKSATECLCELKILLSAQFFTSQESDKLRRGAVTKIEAAMNELWSRRNEASMLVRSRIYVSIGLLGRVLDANVTNAELSDIHRRLEEAEDAVAEVEAPPKAGKKGAGAKAGPYG